jgi:hypothetical protein
MKNQAASSMAGPGRKAISTSTTLTMAKRIAPIADKHM